jgi:hypothetical protein
MIFKNQLQWFNKKYQCSLFTLLLSRAVFSINFRLCSTSFCYLFSRQSRLTSHPCQTKHCVASVIQSHYFIPIKRTIILLNQRLGSFGSTSIEQCHLRARGRTSLDFIRHQGCILPIYWFDPFLPHTHTGYRMPGSKSPLPVFKGQRQNLLKADSISLLKKHTAILLLQIENLDYTIQVRASI